jgi:hypothetical protein
MPPKSGVARKCSGVFAETPFPNNSGLKSRQFLRPKTAKRREVTGLEVLVIGLFTPKAG